MKLNLLVGISLATAILLSGCGSEDTTCRIDVQTAMDKGEFDTAVSKLEGECASTFSEEDRNYNLALAYMGKAGYGVTDILTSLLDANDDENTDDTFTSFASSISETRKADSAIYLQKSQDYFMKALDTNQSLATLCDGANSSDNLRLKDVCFYYGFNQTVTTVDTLTYLTGDLSTALDAINDDTDTIGTPLDLQASLDALAATTGNSTEGNVTATNITIKGNPYIHLDVKESNTSGTYTFYRLANETNTSTLLTDGYCDENGTTTGCDTIENEDGSIVSGTTGCYACPVGLDTNSSVDVVEVLVDAINNGTDAILGLTDDDDTKESVDDFKRDLLGCGDSCTQAELDADITIEQILDYLNK